MVVWDNDQQVSRNARRAQEAEEKFTSIEYVTGDTAGVAMEHSVDSPGWVNIRKLQGG